MRLRDARQILRVKSAREYLAKVQHQAAAFGIPVMQVTARAVGFVNEGRLVAQCSYCEGGIAVSRDYDFAACLDCCHVYAGVLWPDDFARIEAALLARPMRNQNWTPGETADDLIAENIAHGIEEVRKVKR